MIYAVIDTNVLVSAILTHNLQSPTFRVIDAMLARHIVPLYNEEITFMLQKTYFYFHLSYIATYVVVYER